jgi:hypothetical protein
MIPEISNSLGEAIFIKYKLNFQTTKPFNLFSKARRKKIEGFYLYLSNVYFDLYVGH